MYPYPLFGDFDLYALFLCIGVIGAIAVFRIFTDKKKFNWKLYNFCVVTAAVSIVLGYLSAVVFQAFYNIKELGEFVINRQTGATFYGGLIGGAASFLAVYFGIGYFLFKKEKLHIKEFFTVADIAAASIAVAHGFGRIGCLMAGCCHGGATDAWYGIYMPELGVKVVPLQLYEALFLFALFGFFVYRLIKNKTCNLPLYMAIYGVWRFIIEYFRQDDRGSTIVDFLSPSQFIAILMVVGAVALYFGQRAIMKRLEAKYAPTADDSTSEAQSNG